MLKHNRAPFRAFLFFFALLFCAALFAVCSSALTAELETGSLTVSAEITDPTASPLTVTVTVRADQAFLDAHPDETMYLFACQPGADTSSLAGQNPAVSAKIKAETVFRVQDTGKTGDPLYAQYAIALGNGSQYQTLCDGIYVTNPESVAANNASRSTAPSLKGLTVSGELLGDAERLGISHAVLPIVLDDYLIYDYSDYSKTVGTYTTFFNPDRIASLDAEITTLRANGVRILFRFLLDGSTKSTSMPSSHLYDPKAADGASLWGISVTTEEGYARARAVFSFFAERYASDPKNEPVDFLLGYQVNETDWNALGASTLSAHVRSYAATYHVAYTALRTVCSASRVYVPLSNLLPAVRSFLSRFAREADGLAWAVGIAPYNSVPLSDAVWNDTGCDDTLDSVYLTMKNLPVLKTLLSDSAYLYGGKLRPVIIDDFAVQGTSGDEDSQFRQSASLIYSYYRAVNSGFIDAFIWHRVRDQAAEGCNYGLRDLYGAEKGAYRVYQLIDTTMGSSSFTQFLDVFHATRWGTLFDGCNPKKAETVRRYESAHDESVSLEKQEEWFNFLSGSLDGLEPTEHASSLVIADLIPDVNGLGKALQVASFPSGIPYESAGVILNLKEAGVSLNECSHLILTVKADAHGGEDTSDVAITLNTLKGSKRFLLRSEATIPTGAWTTLVFDIAPFTRACGDADTLKISVSCGEIGCTLSVNRLATLHDDQSTLIRILLTIVCIILVMVILGFCVILYLRIRNNRIRRRKQRLAEARRRAESQQRYRSGARPYGSSDPPPPPRQTNKMQ